MRKRAVLGAMCTLALTVLLVPQSALADRPETTCPVGFDLGALTFEESLTLPAVQRALADGIATVSGIQANFDAVDRNNNDLICFQDTFAIAGENPNPASFMQYNLNVIDDNAAKLSGP
jgi:hypothetical protein